MTSYVIMEPPRDRAARDPQYVRDRFAWLGLFFPLVWLLWHRLWIESFVFLAAALLLGGIGEIAGATQGVVAGLAFLLSLLVALEGPTLRLSALRRRGWSEWGVVEANDRGEAEIRYLSATVADAVHRAPLPVMREAPPSSPSAAPEFGLFAYPGRR